MLLPPYLTFPVLHGDGILLRQITLSDIPDILPISWFRGKLAENAEEAWDMQEKIFSEYNSGRSIHWGIVEMQSEKMFGTCGFYRGFKNGYGEVGYILRSDFEGSGLMGKAVELVLNFGFKEMKLTRIFAHTKNDNLRSRKMLERQHFKVAKELENNLLEYELFPPNNAS